jgi:hypothetical protein
VSPAKCLIVVVEDRHADVGVKVFAGAGAMFRALGLASKVAHSMARGHPESINVSLSEYHEAAGYLWFASVGSEGDCVRVQEVALDVG